MKDKIKRLNENNQLYFVITSILFGIIVSMCKSGADDTTQYYNLGNSIFDCWNHSVNYYTYWSSRVLINFIWFAVLKLGRIALGIYSAISMYVLQKSLYSLFETPNRKQQVLFITALTILFPFETLMTAGWTATITSYFGPQAFAIAALIPIKKILNDEKMNYKDMLWGIVAMIYGGNAEQMSIVLFVVYFVAFTYLAVKRKINIKIIFFMLLALANLLNFFLCPGNWVRKNSEIQTWFPDFGMLNVIDKADIGISTTLRWMFADGQPFVILICIMLAYFIWKRYKEPVFRFIALIPAGMTLLLGPFKSAFSSLFSYAPMAAGEVDYYGSFTVASKGIGGGMIQFGLFLLIAVCIVAELFLLNDKIEGLIADLTLVLIGVASRAMMGFSPTVYASWSRTYTTMVVCIMAVAVHIYSTNICLIENNEEDSKEKYIWWGLILIGFLDFIYLIVTAFHWEG